MEPSLKQEQPQQDFLKYGSPPKSNSPERAGDASAERDLRNDTAVADLQPEFGPIPDLSPRITGEPVPLWSVEEMVSDAEAAQATLNPEPTHISSHASFRRLTVVLIMVGLVGFGIYRFYERQQGAVAASLRQKADRARQQGQQELYLQYLRQYIEYKGQDVDGLAELATAMSSQASTTTERESLLTILDRVCRLAPDRHDARRQLVETAMSLGRYHDARSHLKLLEEALPGNGELKLLLGRCYEQEEDFSAAIAEYQASIQCLPEQLDAYEALARLLRNEREDGEQVSRILNQMVVANGQSSDALILRSRFRLSAGDINGAATDIRRACELAPDSLAGHLMVVRLAAISGITNSAELQSTYDLLKKMVDSNPVDLQLYQSLALLDMKLGRLPLAEKWLRRGLEIQPGCLAARLQLNVLLVNTMNFEEARVQFDLPGSGNATSLPIIHAGKCLHAFVLMQHQNWHRATTMLKEVRPELSNEPLLQMWTNFWLAQCFHEIHDSDSEIQLLRRILDDDPSAHPPRRALAHALAAKGNLDDAIGHLSMHRKEAAVALELLQVTFRKTLRDSATSRNWDVVDQALALAEKKTHLSWAMSLLKARIDESRSGAENAIQHLKATVARSPDALEVQLVLVLTALRNGDNQLARETLETARQQFGDDVRIDSAWIHYWSWQAADFALAPMTAIEGSLEKRPKTERLRLGVQLARAWVLRGAYEKAELLWHQLAAQEPANLQLQLLAFESSLNSGHWAASARVLPLIEAIEGTAGPSAAVCRVAELLTRIESGDARDTGEVRAAFRRLQQLCPNWYLTTALEGRVCQLEGQDRRAAECYRLALENGSRDVDVLSRLVALLCRTNQYKDADLILLEFEPIWDGRRSQIDPTRASDIAERAGNAERALALLARKWVRTDVREAERMSAGKVNMFAAEILFSDPDLEYWLIFEPAASPDGTPSRTLGSVDSPFQGSLLTEEQTAFFNAAALNAGSINN